MRTAPRRTCSAPVPYLFAHAFRTTSELRANLERTRSVPTVLYFNFFMTGTVCTTVELIVHTQIRQTTGRNCTLRIMPLHVVQSSQHSREWQPQSGSGVCLMWAQRGRRRWWCRGRWCRGRWCRGRWCRGRRWCRGIWTTFSAFIRSGSLL